MLKIKIKNDLRIQVAYNTKFDYNNLHNLITVQKYSLHHWLIILGIWSLGLWRVYVWTDTFKLITDQNQTKVIVAWNLLIINNRFPKYTQSFSHALDFIPK